MPSNTDPSHDAKEENAESNRDLSPTALKRIHTKEEKEKADEPKAEPSVADEFGLPPRPARRREYSLNELDSPEEIRKQVIEETGGELKQPPKDAGHDGASDSKETVEKNIEKAEEKSSEKFTTPRQSVEDGARSEKQRTASSPSSARSRSGSSPNARHKKQPSVNTVSEFSHQQMVLPEKIEEDEVEEERWQEMPAFATHRIYDDWGKVLAKEYNEAEDETVAYGTLGGAGKGYTRVQMDEDAQSATSMDDNTAYLFKDQYARNMLDDDDEEGRDLVSQMQTTKELLTEGQRIAYVGVVRLAIAAMEKDLSELERTKNTKKVMDFATEALQKWGQKVMLRLYTHMEIDAKEQIMVEQLAEHGVLPADLTPALMANARVKNPNANPESSSQASSSRPSIASPRPTSVAEKRLSSAPPSKPSTPAPPSPVDPPTPSEVDTPPPAYEQHTADELTIQDPEELEDAKNIDIDIRWSVLCDLFLLLIADSTYDSRSRTLLEKVASALSVEWQELCRFEKRVTDALEMQEQAEKENWNEDDHLEARKKQARNKRLAVMGLCTVGGGLVIGLSAGLLAPVIGAGLAAGFTAIGVSGTGTFLGGTGAAALIGTGGTLLGTKVGFSTSSRRTGAVGTFEYKPLFNNKRTNLIVTVAGWMTGKVDDVRLPFSTVDPIMGDIYSVNWEPEMLQSTGQTIQILGTEALTQTIQQILGATVLSTLMAGLSTPLILTKISYLIDNPWTTALARGDAAGLILADSIIDRNLGMRPITLVGFSLGSRVIYACLKELSRRGAVGLIQNVYMFGSPVVAKKDDYIRCRSVVSGRFVNGYATNDWILGYLFRATSGGVMRIAGLASVDVPGIENIDVTEDVPGHMAYRGMMPTLLDKVGWEMESLEYTEIEDPDPDNHEKRQRELLDEIEEARRQLEQRPEKKGFKSFFSRKKATQKKSWETYDERSQKVLEGDDKESEKHRMENANVMFDVDAIRKEALSLALQNPGDVEEIKKHLTVKEIESTLPALKVTLPQDGKSNGAGPSSASSDDASRPELRQTKTHDGRTSAATNKRYVSSPLPNGSNVPEQELRSPTSTGGEGEISMSFEGDRRPSPSQGSDSGWPDAPKTARFGASTSDLNGSSASAGSRPPLRSINTTPVHGKDSVNHNPWSAEDADDPSFGKEAEMKMDFE